MFAFFCLQCIAWTQFWFTIIAGFSDQELYDGVLLNTFNLFYTSLPILFLSTLDRDVSCASLIDEGV